MMWFSSGGTSSVLHTDDEENVNCVYHGKKTVLLVDPAKYGDKACMFFLFSCDSEL